MQQPPALLPPALLIAGPTASGKSALALDLAGRFGGTVINADSMQVYRDLRVLTARPSMAEEARVPHALYGVRDAAEAASVAWWREAALAAMAAAPDLPILVGGTGLYFRALAEGLAPVPPVSAEAREEARGLLAAEGPAALHARLAAADPGTAARLRPSDSQRLARAWEVWRSTGRGLAAWQAAPPEGEPPPWRFLGLRLDPPRDALRAAIRARWQAMLREGAMEEVRTLLSRGLDAALPAMRAHGVPELRAVLEGRLDLDAAGERACLAMGQYTKRQATWWRHHRLGGDGTVTHTIHARYAGPEQLSESLNAEIVAFLHRAR
ncbi:tRNA (adenosine(37)-N6)-dimethylallyltransferase MiaA [Roseomonas sp. OT10]|uniref:tRNA (adenosine(37)-N6)-dimethylallyltransferase MiaA n=1 Tax=Roseomonas cutis TaxID=2897332 RepID=UPI001E2BC19A|nr:tRNA (adenosine(37)-N6)-dimethylallyltransferase MiaA [Roseomonas sp. OT10]UFN51184.1 tRNA (adenosine(37)-N6)-dimethylallyltransferase MiaA [Roseomonas sp. OT10]